MVFPDANRPDDVAVFGPPVADPPLFREQVYQQMRNAILSGRLARGSRLSPAKIAQELGVSTMPVREAIRLLEDDGLVETSARRWTRVASPDWALADETYPLIGLLEEFAIASGQAPTTELLAEARRANDALAAAIEADDIAACLDADDRFHSTFVNNNPNPILRGLIADLKARTGLLEGAYFRTADDARISVQQHAEALEAAAAGDLTLAGSCIRANWHHGLLAVKRAAISGNQIQSPS